MLHEDVPEYEEIIEKFQIDDIKLFAYGLLTLFYRSMDLPKKTFKSRVGTMAKFMGMTE